MLAPKRTAAVLLMSLAVAAQTASASLFMHGRPANADGLLQKFEATPGTPMPKDQYFDQRLDHFDSENTETWKQRWWFNDANFRPGGPIFLQIGGEGRESAVWVVEGAMMDYAEEYGAMAVLLEHRFYGESQPRPDLSTENLKFLSSEQALADLAYFVAALKQQFGLTDANRVVCFGGSYPGALSSFFRLKYPNLVVGAIASSAPVEAELNFSQYLEVVTASLKTTPNGDTCVSAIGQATSDIQNLLQSKAGLTQIQKDFQLCAPIQGDNWKDVANLMSTLAGSVMGVVQYNRDNRGSAKKPWFTIDTVCELMTDAKTLPYQRYRAFNAAFLKYNNLTCLDASYASAVKLLSNTSATFARTSGARQWTWQTCREFGYYQTSKSSKQPFGDLFPLEFSIALCQEAFGAQFDEASNEAGVRWSLTNYGGWQPGSTNVMFVNGSIDPWHYLSVLTDLSESVTAVFINGTAHCANMYPASPDDLPSLKHARTLISAQIGEWLK